MTTVRLPLEIEQKLQNLSESQHKSKSDIIKEALELLFGQEESEIDSFELGKDLFGQHGSGKGNLSTDYKTLLKEKLRARNHTH